MVACVEKRDEHILPVDLLFGHAQLVGVLFAHPHKHQNLLVAQAKVLSISHLCH